MSDDDLLGVAWGLPYHFTAAQLREELELAGWPRTVGTVRRRLGKLAARGWLREASVTPQHPRCYHLATLSTGDVGLRLLCHVLHGRRRAALGRRLLAEGNALGELIVEAPLHWWYYLELLPPALEHELCCLIAERALSRYVRHYEKRNVRPRARWRARAAALRAGIDTRRAWLAGEAGDETLARASTSAYSAFIHTTCPGNPGRIRHSAFVASCAARDGGLWQAAADAPDIGIPANQLIRLFARCLREHLGVKAHSLGRLLREQDFPPRELPLALRGPQRGFHGLFA